MKIAVITPYHNAKAEWLAQCLASVRAQTIACTHFVVSDGKGPLPLSDFTGTFLSLPVCSNNYGDTPRGLASLLAFQQGFDAVAYLDDDNWYHPQHLALLLATQQHAGSALATSARQLVTRSGQPLAPCPHSNGVQFCDTNCLFITRAAADVCQYWATMPRLFHAVGDRYMWKMAEKLGYSSAHHPLPSVYYRSHWASSYELAGLPAPADARNGMEFLPQQIALEQHFASGNWRADVAATRS